jgi:hypothetical protein
VAMSIVGAPWVHELLSDPITYRVRSFGRIALNRDIALLAWRELVWDASQALDAPR